MIIRIIIALAASLGLTIAGVSEQPAVIDTPTETTKTTKPIEVITPKPDPVVVIPPTMVWPVSPTEITSPFGDRPELPFGFHYGLDFGTGWSDPIPAVIGGTVIFTGWNYGNEIRIQNGQYTYLYAHLSRIDVVVGQEVAMGEIIGLSGSTGLSLGPHLHLEIWDNGVPVDPYPILVDQTQTKYQ